MYCEEMHEMINKIPVTLPEPDNHKKEITTDVGRYRKRKLHQQTTMK